MSLNVALLNVTEAARVFGVHARTILRKISTNEISDTQIVREGRETKIYVTELVRIFGEPKSKDRSQKNDDKRIYDNRRQKEISPENVTYSDPRDAHIVGLLREQLETERKQNQEARERERVERERADRMEREASDLRRTVDNLREDDRALERRLLEAPKPADRRGLLARLFGR